MCMRRTDFYLTKGEIPTELSKFIPSLQLCTLISYYGFPARISNHCEYIVQTINIQINRTATIMLPKLVAVHKIYNNIAGVITHSRGRFTKSIYNKKSKCKYSRFIQSYLFKNLRRALFHQSSQTIKFKKHFII